ncbi:exostosin-3 isoform X2 [Tetranychus urticae]|uniref:exostosin-3 isoform X2 n=1 Tax=Tetranychus urticae TaxID=32264 RepID=UPI00077B9E6A|nr:exostosin-3 isoform X2 [Tetranychus urticae]
MLRMLSTRLYCIVFILIFFVVLLFNHYYISKNVVDDSINSNIGASNGLIHRHTSSPPFDSDDLENVYRIDNLKYRINEMLRIRGSVSNELKNLESKRQKLQNEIASLSNRLVETQYQLTKKQSDLNRVHFSVAQAEFTQKETALRNQPFLARPIKLLPLSRPEISSDNINDLVTNGCTMTTCFDYSRCSLTSGFPTYVYSKIIKSETTHLAFEEDAFMSAFRLNPHYTLDGSIACVYVVFIYIEDAEININLSIPLLQSFLHNLDYWSGDGRNHIIVNLNSSVDIIDLGIKPLRALVLQSKFNANHFREGFDVIIPPLNSNQPQSSIQSNCPARRKYLLTYQGSINKSFSNFQTKKLIETMRAIANQTKSDEINFDFNCANNCKSLSTQSTFSLILPPLEKWYKSHPEIINDIFHLFKIGVVPVLIGGRDYKLPFHEAIDWRRSVLHVPIPRISEIHFIVKSFSDSDIIDMRRQAKLIFDRYFSTHETIAKTIFSFIRHQRLDIPALPAKEDTYPFLYNSTYTVDKYLEAFDSALNQENEIDENLGPIESPFPSTTFQRNFSLTLCHGYYLWNSAHLNPFTLYPNTPFDPVLPSDAKFLGSGYGFRPIGQGAGGTGKEFSEALGGNWPKEQFTIIILTYEREAILLDSLQRLRGLPYLNKVLVIWNSPRKPSPDVKWPELGVPIVVIAADQNSLNNRFKPYNQIETEAILSMDDDAHLRHDEIIFGFRVWREARDRVVGFPGRYHAWDMNFNSWLYNSNYSCELSMVLTGAAFFHKYYTYVYTYTMDKAIREKVDEYMNCEDIAMNFLVSHITRQPPIKVTSRWTFRCPGCPVRLSEDDSHFQERHRCINYFTSLYGYNPLLQTQFRADSILFKTRIPHDKQKCFKFL